MQESEPIMHYPFKITVLFVLVLSVALPAFALQSPWMKQEYMRVRLLSAYQGAGNLETLPMGLEIELDEGWYTYWRMAGDAGLPPTFDWSASDNVKEILVQYPTPQRYETAGMHSFGYEGNTLWPVTITPEIPGEAVTLHLKLDTVICLDICIPAHHELHLEIPKGDALQTEHQYRLEQAILDLPQRDITTKLDMQAAVLGKDSVVITAYSAQGFDKADLIIETEDSILTLPPIIEVDSADPKRAVFKIPAPEGLDLPSELFGEKVTATLINDGYAIEKDFQF